MGRITHGLVRKVRNLGDLVLRETYYRPGFRTTPHCHEPARINILIHGELEERVEQTAFTYSPFSSVLKPGGARHSDRYGGGESSCLMVDFLPSFHSHIPKWTLQEARFANNMGSRILARRIWHEFHSWDTVSPLIVEGLVLELLGMQIRDSSDSSHVPAWLARCREMLDVSIQSPPSISQLSATLGVDRSHLSVRFSHHFGLPPGAYVRQRRVERAAELLSTTSLSLAEIAADLGFCDQSHFTRLFESYFHCTPGAFRKSSPTSIPNSYNRTRPVARY